MMSTDRIRRTRVVVTGATGRLGRAVVRHFNDVGFSVTATDIRTADDEPHSIIQADLRDHGQALQLLDGADVVIHLGNHAGIGDTPPQVVFNDNVSINENVFQGAAETSVHTIVFASTIQLIGSKPDRRTVINPPSRPAFPLHGHTTPQPSNVYALSKHIAEEMLRYYAERCGLSTTALRLPLLHNYEEHFSIRAGNEHPDDIFEGFTGLSYADTARLFIDVIRAELQGFNVFMAAMPHRHVDAGPQELGQQFFPESEGLIVDLEPVTAATGWTPEPKRWPLADSNEPHAGGQR